MMPKGAGTRLGEECSVRKHDWKDLSWGQWWSLSYCNGTRDCVVSYYQNDEEAGHGDTHL